MLQQLNDHKMVTNQQNTKDADRLTCRSFTQVNN